MMAMKNGRPGKCSRFRNDAALPPAAQITACHQR